MHQAWVVARLTAYAPKKSDKFIKLEALMQKPEQKGQQQRQTAEEQIAVMQAIMKGRRR